MMRVLVCIGARTPRVDRCAQARVPIDLIANTGLWPQMRVDADACSQTQFQPIKDLQHKNICSHTTKMVSTIATACTFHLDPLFPAASNPPSTPKQGRGVQVHCAVAAIDLM